MRSHFVSVAVACALSACQCGNVNVSTLADAGPGLACGACASSADCDPKGACLGTTPKACAPRCDPGKPICPAGFSCASVEGGAYACVPDDGKCCIDDDQDGYGRGEACAGTDCDDSRPEAHAGATEVCNGLDDDCDGRADEDLAPLTCGVGTCERTVPACTNGTPGTCVPGTPTAEVCNGLDDDCNGVVDDGFMVLTCGVGACERMVAACTGGMSQMCTPGTPSAETCNGVDDDCNGRVDDGLGQQTCGTGACQRNVDRCVDGGVVACVPGPPVSETCNGIDDDCNDAVDDLPDLSCGVGACAVTAPACAGGMGNTCVPLDAGVETCNAIDDDCNGMADDGPSATLCPPPPQVATTACLAGGSCVLTSCNADTYDFNSSYADGCECQAQPASNQGTSCAGAIDLGDLSDTGTALLVSGTLMPMGREVWYRVRAVDSPDTACDNFHFRALLVNNPGDEFEFTVFRGDCATVQCADDGFTDFRWATDFRAQGAGRLEGQCPCVAPGNPPVNNVSYCENDSAPVFIRVRRRASAMITCSAFGLELSNGMYDTP